MSDLRYPVPWDLVFRLGPHIAQGTRAPIDDITAEIVARMDLPPLYQGQQNIPNAPPFVLAANHYQRPALWIAHAASALSMGSGFPVRWIVTSNWPPFRILGRRFPNPGDWLLPRVAHAMGYFPVPFAGTEPRKAARALLALFHSLTRKPEVIGVFPEGAKAVAGKLNPPLPAAGRLFQQFAARGLPVLPARVSESAGRLVVSFGPAIPPETLRCSPDPGELVMHAIADAGS